MRPEAPPPLLQRWLLRAVLAAGGVGAVAWLIEWLSSSHPSTPLVLPQLMPGRPLRVDGAVQHAAIASSDDRVRDAWLADAHAEYASVAAFGRLSLQLVALGAPDALVAEVHRAALDELEHARLCLALAGPSHVQRQPSPLPAAAATLRPVALPELAAESLLDGVLNETLAAYVAEETARVCDAPPAREALRRIATDELRHAALAWQIIEWATVSDAAGVSAALRAAMRQIDAALPPRGQPSGLKHAGRPDDALVAASFERARLTVGRRIARLVGPA
jgi:hypothetical protein